MLQYTRKTTTLHREFVSLISTRNCDLTRLRYCHQKHNNTNLEITTHNANPNAQNLLYSIKYIEDRKTGIARLYDFQLDAILNIVYRPNTSITYEHVIHNDISSSSMPPLYFNYEKDPHCDLGCVAVNDFATGSGKTITSALGAILFHQHRGESVRNRFSQLFRQQDLTTNFYIGSTQEETYRNCIVVMAQKHLLTQWSDTLHTALDMLSLRELYGSVKLSSTSMPCPEDDKPFILLSDAVSKLPEWLTFVPVIIVDEFVIKSPHNIAMCSKHHIYHGRMILISANAGHAYGTSCYTNSILRRWTSVRNKKPTLSRNKDPTSWFHHDVYEDLSIAYSTILSTSHREDAARSVAFHNPMTCHYIKYIPSLAGIMFGTGFEASQGDIIHQFRDLGIDVSLSDMGTIHDIHSILQKKISSLNTSILTSRNKRNSNRTGEPCSGLIINEKDAGDRICILQRFMACINSFVSEAECPICYVSLDSNTEASLISPCLHVICTECMSRMVRASRVSNCPFCRTHIKSHTDVKIGIKRSYTSSSESESDFDSEKATTAVLEDSKATLDETITELMNHRGMPLRDTIHNILISLYMHNCTSEDVYRIMVIVPDVLGSFDEIRNDLHKKITQKDLLMLQFRMMGDRKNHVTRKSVSKILEAFSQDSGPNVRILFTTSGTKDTMTGLNLKSVRALIAVGETNEIQSLGRLTRLGRNITEKIEYFKVTSM